MCGRFTMTRRDKNELAAVLGVPERELDDHVPRFNIAPTQPYFVLRTKYESREAMAATWGLVNSWAKDASRASLCINARAETVDKLPSFSGAFEKRRCVVRPNGFYEWRGHGSHSPVNGRRRSPFSRRPPIDCLSRFTTSTRVRTSWRICRYLANSGSGRPEKSGEDRN
jgi:putative SOS response-associated peptidase YedK